MKKKIAIGFAVVLTAAIAVFVLTKDEPHRKTDTDPTLPGKINYSPPTEKEKRETEQFKKNQQNNSEEPAAPSPTNKKRVTPEISYASQYDSLVEAAAFVAGIFEDGGTCTYTFTNGSKTVTRATTGIKDATTTRCPSISESAGNFSPKGTWSVVVKYQSNNAEGSSQSVSFEVK